MGDGISQVLVLDTSVVINLLASGMAKEILSATCSKAVVVEHAHRELCRESRERPRRRAQNKGMFDEFVQAGVVQVVNLDAQCFDLFLELVSAGLSDSLDDGEASTIAFASTFGFDPVLDDAKARRIFRQRFGNLEILSSVDLFRRYGELAGMEEVDLRDLLFRTLREGRMRVLFEHENWIRNLLGADLVGKCDSLKRRKVS